MKKITFNIYEVYYMDNDRQKKVVGNKLSYQNAHKLKYNYARDGIYCFVSPVFSG